MAFTVGNQLEELKAPSFTISQEHVTARRTLRLIDGADLDDYIDELLGTSDQAGAAVFRTHAATFPGKRWLKLKSIDVKPFNDPFVADSDGTALLDANGLVQPKNGYEIELEYETKEWEDEEEEEDDPATTYLTHRITGSSSLVTHAESALRWERDDSAGLHSVPDDARPGFPKTIVKHNITWHNVPFLPTYLYDFLNTVNDDVFLTHPKETVMLDEISAERSSRVGERMWKIDMTLSAVVIRQTGADTDGSSMTPGWNHFIRPPDSGDGDAVDDQMYHRIINETDTAADKFILPTKDYDTLFQLPTV